MDSEIFKTLPPTKLFFRCTIPSVITMLAGTLYQIADGLFVGRFIGEDALAAVNLVMPVIMMIFAFSNMIATGSSVRISVLLGEGKREDASKAFSFTVKFIFLISFIIGILGLLFSEGLVRFLSPDASEKAIDYAIIYLRMHALFSPLIPIYFATDNFLRVCGKEKLSMYLGIGTQLLNILLDVILIAFLGQGIWAAAFTSCFAMAIGSLITLSLFVKRRLDLYYVKGNLPLRVIRNILLNGSSEFFSNISMSFMSVVYNFFLLEYGGTTAVAAFSVIMYVDSISGMTVFGICDSLSPAISYCYGAGLLDKVKAIFKRILISAALLSLLSTLFMFFLGPFVAPLFIKPEDTHLLEVSIIGMKMFSLSYITGWVDMCFSSYFTALERPFRSLLTSFFGTVFFPIASLFILTPYLSLNGVWLSALASCSAGAIFTLILAFTMRSRK